MMAEETNHAAADAATPTLQEAALQRLRADLRRELAFQKKNSLYSVIGMPADSSDAAIADGIRQRLASGAPLDPEFHYAVEILGDADARAGFDRKLMEQLRHRAAPASASLQAAAAPAGFQVGNALKVLVGAIVVLGLTYLGLDYRKEQLAREVRIKEVELRNEEVRRAAEIAERLVETRRLSVEASIAAQERQADAQERAQLDARAREDKYRLDQSLRQEQQLSQAEQRRQQMERDRLLSESRRKDAEAAAATRAIRQQAIQDAIARGNHNEAQRLRNQQY